MKKIVVLVSIVMMLLCLFQPVSANKNSMNVIVCFSDPGDNKDYEIGDNVVITVYVFDKGELADADTTPEVKMNEWRDNQRNISVDRIGTGIYKGTFTILNEDVDGSFISINAKATIGKTDENDTTYDEDVEYDYIFVFNENYEDEDDLDVEIVFDDYENTYPFIEAIPGQTYDITVTVTNNGNNFEPDELTIYTEDYYTEEETPISYTNPSTGIYIASYTASSPLDTPRIIIGVRAEHNGSSDQRSMYLNTNFFSIWFHRNIITNTSASFEIWVADLEGNGVEGANVEFTYELNDQEWIKSTDTDSAGKAYFTISYEDIESLSIEGEVTHQGRIQAFSHYITIEDQDPGSDIEEPDEDEDFQVIYQENEEDIQPDSSVALDYIAYENGNILPDQIVYFYVYTEYGFITSGYRTSDENGKFSISFNTPKDEDSVRIDFESPFDDPFAWTTDSDDGFEYRTDSESHYTGESYESMFNVEKDEGIKIETTPLTIGGQTRISYSKAGSEGFRGTVIIIPGEFAPYDIQTGEQIPKWYPLSYSSYHFSLIPESGKVETDITLPEFLPADETYTIFVGLYDMDPERYDTYWNTLSVKPGEQATTEDGDDNENPLMAPAFSPGGFDIPLYLLLILLIVILVVVIAAVKRRKGGRGLTQPYDPPTEDQNQNQYPFGGYNQQNQNPPGPGPY
jgi:hypothetical protein